MSQVKSILDTMEYGPAPEDAKLAQEWIDQHDADFGLFIGGLWVKSDQSFSTSNPATGKHLAKLSQGTESHVEDAVKAAERASKEWTKIGPSGRAKYLYALARQIQKHSRLFAVLETLDNGKPIRETRDLDIPLVARHFYYHAGWAKLIDKEFSNYEPVGVCGQIIPWNFPLLMLAWKIAPALAAGNTVILKPAEFTSLTAILFAEICEKVGLPKGVVNIVTGDGETGRAIVEHHRIKKIAFTGSTEVGKLIRKSTAGSGKKLSLELGGKSPFIVFEDADLDSVVEGIVDAIWFNQGQVCCAGSRLLVQEGLAEKLYAKIRQRMQTLRVGSPLDKAVDIGAIVDSVQLKRISELVDRGVEEGANIFQTECQFPEGGWFFPPTLLTNVEPSQTVAQVEIFGPVLVAMTFRTPAEAVALANNTVYGLAASIWTQNLDVAHDIAAKVKAGTIWINCTNQFDASSGFGGFRESGYGREGGKEGMYEYLKPKRTSPTKPSLPKDQKGTAGNDLDRTHKLFIGGKQVRPDSGYSLTYLTSKGEIEVSRGNRKDLRNAVEAAEVGFTAWSSATAFNRAQVLYYFAENLEGAKEQVLHSLISMGISKLDAEKEFAQSVDFVLDFAARADKHDGQVHHAPLRALVYTRNEPIGPAVVVAPESHGLLGLIGSTIPLIAMGNSVVSIPSYANPLPAVELYRIIEASDFPAGVWNILTGIREELEPSAAEHDGVQVFWHFGGSEAQSHLESSSIGNLKQTWCPLVHPADIDHEEFLRRATQVKNIWTPYGA
jgi:aldehyde dehydrogenase (NAD+)